MNSSFDITVITVCYNSEKTIARTLRSVINAALNSTFNVEYVIIDGDSTDQTLNIINAVIKNLPTNLVCHVYSGKDQGIYDAMNKGVIYSSGDIIGFLNSDDEYLPEALQSIVATFKSDDNLDLIHGDVIWRYSYPGANDKFVYHQGDSNIHNLKFGMTVNHPTLYCRRSIYMNFGLFDLTYKYVADWRWATNLLLSEQKINVKYLSSPLVIFDMGGVSSQVRSDRYLEIARGHVESYRIGFLTLTTLAMNCISLFREFVFSLLYHTFIPAVYRSRISKARKGMIEIKLNQEK